MPARSPLRRRRLFQPLIIALAVVFAVIAIVTWLPLRTARVEWRSGRFADAISTAGSWSRTRMWPNQYHQILAIAYTSAGRRQAAREQLAQLPGKLWISLVPKDEVARRFFERGDYESFIEYDKAVRERSEPADVPLYRATALVALGRYGEAAHALETMDRSGVGSNRLAKLETTIAQRRTGRFAFVFDRSGVAIADSSAGGLIAVDRDFAPLIEETGGTLTFGAHRSELGDMNTVETTLDSAVQHAAKAALGNYRGAFVAIDPRTNEVLAIVSNDSRNLALEEQYEPGSIIKVLTGLDALNSGTDVLAMFPYHCSGELVIDGRHFPDWVPSGHGTLPDLDEALAESCNVFFADVGIRLGAERMQRFMTTAGFDGQTDLGIFKVPLGRFVGDVPDKYETGYFAIGLEHESVNAMHVAMLASMMANRGVLTTPRLIRARRSVLGEVVTGPAPQAQARIALQEIAERMVQAMAAVASRPKGTGRRAVIEGVSLALKTGTAGKRKDGYHAVIMAFAPVDSPKIAFGLIAERSGPAEFAGAKIAHDFLLQIRDRLK